MLGAPLKNGMWAAQSGNCRYEDGRLVAMQGFGAEIETPPGANGLTVVYLVVAMKRKCEPSILELLARDTDERVRERVVFNAKTPVAVLEILAKDPSERIADAAAVRLQSRGASLPTGHRTAGLTTTYQAFSSLQQRQGKVVGKPDRFRVVDGWVKSVDHLAEVEVSVPH